MSIASNPNPEVERLLGVIESLYGALDDASSVVDKSDDEEYAYQAELESAADVLEEYGRHTGRQTP